MQVSSLFTPEAALIDSETGAINTYFNVDGSASYEITKAFKYVNVGKLNTPKIKFTDDKDGETGKKASELASVNDDDLTLSSSIITNTISLKNLRNPANAPTQLGYGEVLPMEISSNSYDNWLYQTDADKKYSFKVTMMSALYEGEVRPVSGTSISVSANAESAAIITSDMIKGYDYNNNEYEVIPNKVKTEGDEYKNDWTRDGVKEVTATVHQDYVNLVKSIKINPATKEDNKTVNGNIELQTSTLSNDTEIIINVSVTDIWGYTKVSPVKVLVKVNK